MVGRYTGQTLGVAWIDDYAGSSAVATQAGDRVFVGSADMISVFEIPAPE